MSENRRDAFPYWRGMDLRMGEAPPVETSREAKGIHFALCCISINLTLIFLALVWIASNL